MRRLVFILLLLLDLFDAAHLLSVAILLAVVGLHFFISVTLSDFVAFLELLQVADLLLKLGLFSLVGHQLLNIGLLSLRVLAFVLS